jgi:hypothetical protein
MGNARRAAVEASTVNVQCLVLDREERYTPTDLYLHIKRIIEGQGEDMDEDDSRQASLHRVESQASRVRDGTTLHPDTNLTGAQAAMYLMSCRPSWLVHGLSMTDPSA